MILTRYYNDSAVLLIILIIRRIQLEETKLPSVRIFHSVCNSPSWKKIRNSILYEKSFAYSKIISTDCPDNHLLLAIVKKINRGLAQSPWHQYNLFFNFQFVTWIIKNLHGRAWIFSPTSNPDLILTLDSDCCTLFIPFLVNHLTNNWPCLSA